MSCFLFLASAACFCCLLLLLASAACFCCCLGVWIDTQPGLDSTGVAVSEGAYWIKLKTLQRSQLAPECCARKTRARGFPGREQCVGVCVGIANNDRCVVPRRYFVSRSWTLAIVLANVAKRMEDAISRCHPVFTAARMTAFLGLLTSFWEILWILDRTIDNSE